jgi:ribosomal protein S18 acetylase RimI-like enzyme
MEPPTLSIRRAVPEDAAGIVAVLETVASERIHSAIDAVWSVEEERQYLKALSPREAVHVAVDEIRGIVGLQILDQWSSTLTSMAHVGQIGTLLLPDWRRQGLGRQLWNVTLTFARDAGYRKFVIQVRASNTAALGFYRRLGFVDCGRLTRQVIIDGVEDDEVVMERFVQEDAMSLTLDSATASRAAVHRFRHIVLE